MSQPKKPVPPPGAVAKIHDDDEVVHVPRGRSRKQYLLYIGLSIFMLIIYVVPQQFQQIAKRRPERDAAYLTWKHPRLGEQAVADVDFRLTHRRLESVYRMAGMPSNDQLDDDNIARILVLDALAQEAGIEVSDRELAEKMREVCRAPDNKTVYAQCEARRVKPDEYQDGLRQFLRVDRYESMVSGAAAAPGPDQLEQEWKKNNQEYSFDVVALDVAGSMADATAQLPADPELKTWYDALPSKQRLFAAEWKPERASAELLGWRLDTDDPAPLLEKFPRPAGTDAEALAKDYYNKVAYLRFRPEGASTPQTFEEVADKARRESKVYEALVDWQKSMNDRVTKGETIDFATEAVALGLQAHIEKAPKTAVEWNATPDFGGPSVTDAILRGGRAPDKSISVSVTTRDMWVGRALEYVAAGAPPFEEVHDKAVEEWKKQKAVEVTQKKLQDIYDALKTAMPPPPAPVDPEKPPVVKVTADAAAFEAKVKEAGLSTLHVDWFQQRKLPATLPENPGELERFLSEVKTTGRFMYDTEENEVSAPAVDSKKERVWLVRSLGKRDPSKVEIEPKDLESLQQMASYTKQQKLREDVFSAKGFAAQFGLKFLHGRNAPPAETPPKS
jgi:hypothetical protein